MDGMQALRAALPEALARVLRSYRAYAEALEATTAEAIDDPLIFNRRQAAAKAAVQHIEALIRVAERLAKIAPPQETASARALDDDTARLVAEARTALLELQMAEAEIPDEEGEG